MKASFSVPLGLYHLESCQVPPSSELRRRRLATRTIRTKGHRYQQVSNPISGSEDSMASHLPREERRTTFLKVRVRCESGWRDATIGNVSSRGLMLRGPSLPAKGGFVEIRHGLVSIIARVVWSQGYTCGVRTQDTVDIDMLLSLPSAPRSTPGVERRQAPRQVNKAKSAAQRAEESRNIANVLDWAIVAAGGAVAAAAVSVAASASLQKPLQQVSVVLAPSTTTGQM